MRIVWFFVFVGLTSARLVAAVSLASQDTFAATSENWSIGAAGTQPSRNSGAGFDGQPGFLTHFSDNASANGKWLMFSGDADWIGNYVSAAVTGITFWADEEVGTSLSLRIAFNGPGGWFYSAGQTITNSTGGPDWTELSFALSAGNFTYADSSGGTGIFADTMANVTRFEIFGGSSAITYHSNGNLLEAGASVNTVGIDQITAVPEQSVISLLLPAAAAGILLRRLRTRRDD